MFGMGPVLSMPEVRVERFFALMDRVAADEARRKGRGTRAR